MGIYYAFRMQNILLCNLFEDFGASYFESRNPLNLRNRQYFEEDVDIF